MDRIRAGLGDQVDDPACRSSYFGGIRISLNPEFLQRVFRWFHHDGSDITFVIINAINQVAVGVVTLAVDGYRGRTAPVVGTVPTAQSVLNTFAGAGAKLRESDKIAAIQRGVLNDSIADQISDNCAIRLQGRRLRSYFHRFAGLPNFETNVLARAVTNCQRYRIDGCRTETSVLYL